MTDITQEQYEKIQKVKTYLRNVGKHYFKNNKSTRKKIGMGSGTLRSVTVLLVKEGVLRKYGTASHPSIYTVNFDLV